MPESTPRLSVIAVSRNDDHGINLHRRMQTFVNAFINQCKRHDLHAELILVEWNPPADRPKLARSLSWPANPSPCDVRIIEVPPELHARYRCGSAMPLYQMIGKNVGIRRTRGEFILCTNIDIILDDALMRFLKHGDLEKGKYYRIDRTDVDADVPVDGSIEEQLAYCRTHLLRVNAIQATLRLNSASELALSTTDVTSSTSGISLIEGWYETETDRQGRVFRWADEESVLAVQHPAGGPRRLLVEVWPGPGVRYGSFDLHVEDETGRLLASGRIPPRRSLIRLDLGLAPGSRQQIRLKVKGGGQQIPSDNRILNFAVSRIDWDSAESGSTGRAFQVVRLSRDGLDSEQPGLKQGCLWALQDTVTTFRRWLRRVRQSLLKRSLPFLPARLHNNACGDFTLMAREHWFDLRAYAEFDMYSLHIDSLLCYSAHYSGIEQVLLPRDMHCYHIEHSAGSGWTPEGENQLFERLARRGIPMMTLEDLYRWTHKMHQAGHGRLFNDDNWGLAQDRLPQTWIGAGGSEAHAA